MTTANRPRVAAIGLDDSQIHSIAQLCGHMRTAKKLDEYLQDYDWTETDIVVSRGLEGAVVSGGVHLLSIGRSRFNWPLGGTFGPGNQTASRRIRTDIANTEREVSIAYDCPDRYKSLADRLLSDIRGATIPPHVIDDSSGLPVVVERSVLVATTSNKPVAMQFLLSHRHTETNPSQQGFAILVLPEAADLQAWFRAFLFHVHKIDPQRVPHSPPQFSVPSDWYTPEERALAGQMEANRLEVMRQNAEYEQLQAQLEQEGEQADKGIRQAIFGDGDELVTAVSRIFSDLGFGVHDMDADLEPNEPRKEDLRLTHPTRPAWEAIVEVKGYTNGTRTNDARQVREHRDKYIVENGRPPDLTMWVTNPFRQMDPSSRPRPGSNVEEAARNVEAVHVLSADLYKRWADIKAGDRNVEDAVQELVGSSPGLWNPRRRTGPSESIV